MVAYRSLLPSRRTLAGDLSWVIEVGCKCQVPPKTFLFFFSPHLNPRPAHTVPPLPIIKLKLGWNRTTHLKVTSQLIPEGSPQGVAWAGFSSFLFVALCESSIFAPLQSRPAPPLLWSRTETFFYPWSCLATSFPSIKLRGRPSPSMSSQWMGENFFFFSVEGQNNCDPDFPRD